MTLKKLFLAAMASVLVSTGMQAQVENFEIFRHVGGNLNVGTEGIGFDVATPVTDYLEVSAGMSFMPGFKVDGDVNVKPIRITDVTTIPMEAVNIEGGYRAYLRLSLSRFMENDAKDQKELKTKEIEHSIIKTFRKTVWRPFTKALNEYQLIQEGDKIAVCISGGKDSMLMAKLLQELKRHGKIHFELVFLVMNPGYNADNWKIIQDNAELLGIPLTVFESDIFDTVAEIENNPCYLCARMRRGYLYSHAKELGCNKIALGHHYDDVIETILMGMLYGAQIQTMMPKLHSTNFEGMELIRRLYLVREDDIKAWRDYNGLHFIQCACKFTDTCTTCNNEENRSKRVEIKELIKNLKKVNPFVESNIFRSVENVNIDTVVGYKQHGIRHNFLEGYDDNPGYVPEAEKAAAETEQEKEGK